MLFFAPIVFFYENIINNLLVTKWLKKSYLSQVFYVILYI